MDKFFKKNNNEKFKNIKEDNYEKIEEDLL